MQSDLLSLLTSLVTVTFTADKVLGGLAHGGKGKAHKDDGDDDDGDSNGDDVAAARRRAAREKKRREGPSATLEMRPHMLNQVRFASHSLFAFVCFVRCCSFLCFVDCRCVP
jgi:hypothetical protein